MFLFYLYVMKALCPQCELFSFFKVFVSMFSIYQIPFSKNPQTLADHLVILAQIFIFYSDPLQGCTEKQLFKLLKQNSSNIICVFMKLKANNRNKH